MSFHLGHHLVKILKNQKAIKIFMKKITLLVLFSIITLTAYSQSQNIKNSEFLNIDLTKNLSDYGYSTYDLKKALNPVSLENLKENNNHFLSSSKFDTEVALFSEQGYIRFIMSVKSFIELEHGSETTVKAEEFYHNIVNLISNEYGISSSGDNSTTEWDSSNYKIILTLNSDNIVSLLYSNLNIKNLEKTKLTKEISSDNIYAERKDRTERLELYFTDFLKALEQVDIRSFARLNGEVMEIYFERNQDLTPSYEDSDTKKEIRKLEINSFEDIAVFVISKTCSTEGDLETLSKTALIQIKFIQDIYYKDGTESHLTRAISIGNLLQLKTPLRKKEILDIIY